MTTADKTTTCKVHGDMPWKGHVQCSVCGAAYTTKVTMRIRLPTHAPSRCANCRSRLMPAAGRSRIPYTAILCCAACFADAKGEVFDDGHDKGDPACKGLECPFHGPMLKKLARRAHRANVRESGIGEVDDKSGRLMPAGSLPGVLGDVMLYPQAKS